MNFMKIVLRNTFNSLPKSFKWLIFVNVFFVIASIFISFGFSFFGFGGYPPLAFLGGIFLMFSLLSHLSFYAMTGIDLILILYFWKKVRFCILIPLLIIGVGFFAISGTDNLGFNLANSRFDKYFSQYEKIATMVHDGSLPIKEDYVILPSGYRHLGFMSNAYVKNDDPNDPNNTMIEFIVGSGGFAGHVAYLYSSNGTFDNNTRIGKRWPHRKQVKPNWFRSSD